jgi:EpsD family peptidyl-prolyl cis-trans isomerase
MSFARGHCSGFFAPLVAASILAACGGPAKLPASQVVAQVNNKEITISQLSQVLNSEDPESVTPQVAKNAIDSLVDEELLIQGALKQKLDRDPALVRQIEYAKREILAREFAKRVIWPKDEASAKGAEEYFRANPDLFENRKVYQMTVYTVPSVAMTDVLREDLDKTRSSDQVRAALQRHETRFETDQRTAAAEEIPLDQLSSFAKASPGDVLIVPKSASSVLLIAIDSVESKPIGFERAKPMIEQYLVSTQNKKAVDAYLREQRLAAKIVYGDTFAKYEKSDAASSQATSNTPFAAKEVQQ